MAIPTYDEMMLPLLRLLADGQEHHQRDLSVRIADEFKLTDDERNLMLPSTQTTSVRNRVGWAGFHLRKAGLAELSREATLRITPSGAELLKNPPPRLNRQVLMDFEPFKKFMLEQKQRGPRAAQAKAFDSVPPITVEEDEATPEERIGTAFAELRETLVADLLAKLATINPFRFEQVVLDLLVAMGYGGSRKEAAAVTQKTGDEGIDGVINEDRLGLDVIYIQAKRWKANVGRPEIQSFVGALAGKKASKGVFITTSSFHENAREYATGLHQKVILIDGQRLAELMIEHDIGVAEEHAYHVKKIDSDYFEEN
ncbi:MAG: restriction endonuclease [Chthoniobacter sp.]|nr:restriction endonuclease [Chthoniobacter sp.]